MCVAELRFKLVSSRPHQNKKNYTVDRHVVYGDEVAIDGLSIETSSLKGHEVTTSTTVNVESNEAGAHRWWRIIRICWQRIDRNGLLESAILSTSKNSVLQQISIKN